jgi:hypothetical protein
MINQKQKRCGVHLLDQVELKKPNRKCASASELSVDQYKRTGLGQWLTMSSIKNTCSFNPRCPGVNPSCPVADLSCRPDMRESTTGQFSVDP